jgi:hypothetical protein
MYRLKSPKWLSQGRLATTPPRGLTYAEAVAGLDNERREAYALLIRGLLGLRSPGISESEFLAHTLPSLLAAIDSAEPSASKQAETSPAHQVSPGEQRIVSTLQPARRPRLLVAGLTVVTEDFSQGLTPLPATSPEGAEVTTLRLRPDLEAALRNIQGIRAASVVTNGKSEPTEIHILAMSGKAPKQIVRDVQSLAMAQFDLDIDHRIVSVVQLEDSDLGSTPPQQPSGQHDSIGNETETKPDLTADVVDFDLREPVGLSVVPDARNSGNSSYNADATARVMAVPERVEVADEATQTEREDNTQRPTISAIAVRTSGDEAEVSVVLTANGHTFEGQLTGPANISHRPRLVAQATLAAVSELLGQQATIESVTIIPSGSKFIVLTVVSIMTPRVGEQDLTGSALIRGDETDAVARSVLDALNRRISG